jgi:hypothetical protein
MDLNQLNEAKIKLVGDKMTLLMQSIDYHSEMSQKLFNSFSCLQDLLSKIGLDVCKENK